MLSKSEDGKRCVKKTDKCPRLCLTNTYNVVLKLAIQCSINCVVSSLIQQGLELRRFWFLDIIVYHETAFLPHAMLYAKLLT
jgi:hypothetical protein